MQHAVDEIDLPKLQASWVAFNRQVHLRPVHNHIEYDRMVGFMNVLLDVVGDNAAHPLAGLLELVAGLVEAYDEVHHAIEASDPRDVLRYLLEIRGLTQSDLAGIVPQGNLSAILAGKRKISATLAGKLARFFKVSPGVFISA
jgi:HTH-type transcriptional regulator/antitoxin HigA